MENKKILNVTFPRSGHHLLRQCLSLYFKDDFHYCHYDHHCKSVPCTDPKNNMSKKYVENIKFLFFIIDKYIKTES